MSAVFGDDFIAGAIKADGVAERDVKIEREVLVLGRRLHKLDRRGVFRIAVPVQQHANNGRVVHVRVPLVVELEDPAAWLNLYGVLVKPVAAKTNLAIDQQDFERAGRLRDEEKRLIEACLALLDRKLVVGIQDLGGAGLVCATSETAAA